MEVLATIDTMCKGGSYAADAWKHFLDRYSKFILKIIWLNEQQYDQAMDKYLYVCTKLSENNFSVVKKYRTVYGNNSSHFTAWLSVVVRNLCIDAHRKEFGRKRFPKLLLSMSETDREFFKLYYWKGLSMQEIDHHFFTSDHTGNRSGPEILHDIETKYMIAGQKTPKRCNNVRFEPYIDGRNYNANKATPHHEKDLGDFLRLGISQLPDKEQLVLKLRFWEDISPMDIAEILKLSPRTKVYSILKQGLVQLRYYCLEDN